MKSILLIGAGRFGRHIAMKLSELGHEVMALDKNEERVDAVLPYTVGAQIGDGTNETLLSTLGVRSYDACIVAIGDDFLSSLQTVSLLRELGARQVIARASTGVQEKFLLRNGADEVVYPEKQLGTWTAIRCTSDHILDYIELDGEYAIFELMPPDEWDGRTILQLDIRREHGINILAMRENGKLNMKITPDTVISRGKSMLVLGHEKAIHRCFRI